MKQTILLNDRKHLFVMFSFQQSVFESQVAWVQYTDKYNDFSLRFSKVFAQRS